MARGVGGGGGSDLYETSVLKGKVLRGGGGGQRVEYSCGKSTYGL